jgi:hypothetical protein
MRGQHAPAISATMRLIASEVNFGLRVSRVYNTLCRVFNTLRRVYDALIRVYDALIRVYDAPMLMVCVGKRYCTYIGTLMYY